jgi:hypothetical protein
VKFGSFLTFAGIVSLHHVIQSQETGTVTLAGGKTKAGIFTVIGRGIGVGRGIGDDRLEDRE